ncbi:MAG: hypothetical protein RSE16_03715 [Sphingobium sp.]|nr:MAG: hypothetical protein RSE16_03715 [Sphingobium sp.]
MHPAETLDDTAKRVLQDKAHLVNLPVEQLYSFSDPKRDPRGWVVSVAYFALVPFAKLEEAPAAMKGSRSYVLLMMVGLMMVRLIIKMPAPAPSIMAI